MSKCDSTDTANYKKCKDTANTDMETIMQDIMGSDFDFSKFDVEAEAKKGKSMEASDGYSECLKQANENSLKLKGKSMNDAFDKCFEDAETAGYDVGAEADEMEKEEKDMMKKMGDRFKDSMGSSTSSPIDMSKKEGDMTEDEKTAKTKFQQSMKDTMASMKDLFTGEEGSAENDIKFSQMMDKSAVSKIKDMFTGKSAEVTDDQVRQKIEATTGKTATMLDAKKFRRDAQADDAMKKLKDNKDKTQAEQFSATKKMLQEKYGGSTVKEVPEYVVRKTMDKAREQAASTAISSAVQTSIKAGTVTKPSTRIAIVMAAMKATGRKDVTKQEAAKVVTKVIDNSIMDTMADCMTRANKDSTLQKACFKVVRDAARATMGVTTSGAALKRRINKAGNSKITDMMRDCYMAFRNSDADKTTKNTARRECMKDVKTKGAACLGHTTEMKDTQIEQAAIEGTATESVDSIVSCIQENSDKSDPRSACKDQVKTVVADAIGLPIDEVKPEDSQEYVNAGIAKRDAEETQACRTAAGDDEVSKSGCTSSATFSKLHKDTTGEDSTITTNAAKLRKMEKSVYLDAAIASAESEDSEAGEATAIAMLKESTGIAFDTDEASLNKFSMERNAGATSVMTHVKACRLAAARDDRKASATECEKDLVKDHQDRFGVTTSSSGGGRRRRLSDLDKVPMKQNGAKALIEARIQACVDSGKETNALKVCVFDSTQMNDEYSLLRGSETKANDIRQVISTMSAQREVDCRNAGGTVNACKNEGKQLMDKLKHAGPIVNGIRSQETYDAARARHMYVKFNDQMECDAYTEASKIKACEDSVASEGMKLGFLQGQLRMARLQSLKSMAAQKYADSKTCDTCGFDDADAKANAKAIYLKVGSPEDWAVKQSSIIKLGKALYNGEATEVRTSEDEVDTLVVSPKCDKISIMKDWKKIKSAASAAKTIIVSQPSTYPSTNCQVVYKSKVASGSAATIATAITSAMTRRRARLLITEEREVSSSPSSEEVVYGEKSEQDYVEPEPMDEDDTTEIPTPSTSNNDISEDEDYSSNKLSSSTTTRLSTVMVTILIGFFMTTLL